MKTLTTWGLLALPLLACECRRLTVCDLMEQPTLFIGEVIEGGISSIREDPWHSNVDHARFRIIESFRGLPAGVGVVDVQLAPTFGMCAPIPYYLGKKYLLAPRKLNGKFFEGGCFSGRDIESASDEVRQVQDHFQGRSSFSVRGQIAADRDSSSVDFALSQGEAKALKGVRVSTTREGQIYSTVSDAEGKYRLILPGPGAYDLRASLESYNTTAERVSLGDSGCEFQDFGLTTDNTISGHVWDERGQPIEHARVGLIDLDRTLTDPDRHAWFNAVYVGTEDRSFTFENVPLGRYLLVFNPDGPRKGGLFDLPLESSYYPLNSTRATARPIQIDSNGIHIVNMDLVAGKPVDFREVSVKVRFPDGAPMKTASVRCTGLPVRNGEFTWVDRRSLPDKTDGLIKFTAPANRTLKLEVEDWYGRALKGSYTSMHEAGSSAIFREFVVTP